MTEKSTLTKAVGKASLCNMHVCYTTMHVLNYELKKKIIYTVFFVKKSQTASYVQCKGIYVHVIERKLGIFYITMTIYVLRCNFVAITVAKLNIYHFWNSKLSCMHSQNDICGRFKCVAAWHKLCQSQFDSPLITR